MVFGVFFAVFFYDDLEDAIRSKMKSSLL